MQNFRALGAPPPEPCASGGWGLCPQTPSLRRLGAPPPDPPNTPPPNANFWLRACVCHWYFRKFCGLKPDCMTFLGWRPFFFFFFFYFFFFFFWRSPVFGRKNCLNSNFGRKIPYNFSEDLFLGGGRKPVFGRKKRLNSRFRPEIPFQSSPCSFDPDWDKFLVPPCPSRIHINKLFVPPQNLFLPPSHAILAPGLYT